jgi:hypothetical protein
LLLVSLALGALLAGNAAGAGRECLGGVLSLYVENDLFFRTDRDYTSGVRLAWVSPDIEDDIGDKCVPAWVQPINEKVRDVFALRLSTANQRNMVITLGQAMYTPSDKTRSDLIREDRPYAGWMYLGLGYNERRRPLGTALERLDSLEVNLGVVGPLALAKQTQDLIHDLRGVDRFNGWQHQLKTEPGLQVIAERKYRARSGGGKADAIAHYGVSLGNVATYVNAGLELRWGTGIPNDFGSSPIRPAGNNTAPGSFPRDGQRMLRRGVHAFASFDARAVARDIFLDGNTFRHGHHVKKVPLVADLAVGIAAFSAGWKFSFGRVFRSREFAGQPSRHSYGSFTVSRDFE